MVTPPVLNYPFSTVPVFPWPERDNVDYLLHFLTFSAENNVDYLLHFLTFFNHIVHIFNHIGSETVDIQAVSVGFGLPCGRLSRFLFRNLQEVIERQKFLEICVAWGRNLQVSASTIWPERDNVDYLLHFFAFSSELAWSAPIM